ncbi:hypothetical protein PybrP1_009551 [[Pythium] brassicae (nom. inval.)]|nr:hypothetical protein PybrP1_009551 [[Pythium] brassicae (nom. inval.)]
MHEHSRNLRGEAPAPVRVIRLTAATHAGLESEQSDEQSWYGNRSDHYGPDDELPRPVIEVQRSLISLFGSESDDEQQESKAADPPEADRSSPAADDDDSDGEQEGVDLPGMVVTNIQPVLDDDDVNLLADGEDINDYHSDVDTRDGMVGEIPPLEGSTPSPPDADEEYESVDRVTEAFMEAIGGAVRMEEGAFDTDALRGMQWETVTGLFEQDAVMYPDMVRTRGRLTDATQNAATSPLALFVHFILKALWVEMNADTNHYRNQQLEARALVVQAKQRNKRALDPAAGCVVGSLGAGGERARACGVAHGRVNGGGDRALARADVRAKVVVLLCELAQVLLCELAQVLVQVLLCACASAVVRAHEGGVWVYHGDVHLGGGVHARTDRDERACGNGVRARGSGVRARVDHVRARVYGSGVLELAVVMWVLKHFRCGSSCGALRRACRW